MRTPDFSEAQLQSVCNMEICKKLGKGVYPVIPSLIEEKNLGWDSGFMVGDTPPATNQKGCNFFVQYKLGVLVEGPRGGQYNNWYQPYFRFETFHEKKDGNKYVKDFHQFERLKSLSDEGYPVWYIANSVLETTELFDGAQKDIDLVVVAVDVCQFDSQHERVTYTQSSSHVILHSEPMEIERERLANVRDRLLSISRDTASTLQDDINTIPRLLFGAENSILSEFRFNREFDVVYRWHSMTRLIFLLTGLRVFKLMS